MQVRSNVRENYSNLQVLGLCNSIVATVFHVWASSEALLGPVCPVLWVQLQSGRQIHSFDSQARVLVPTQVLVCVGLRVVD